MKSSIRRLVESQYDRRSFFKTLGASAAGAAVAGRLSDEDVEGAVKNVRRNSIPSQLKITESRSNTTRWTWIGGRAWSRPRRP
jgi:hypothetical protein